MKRGFDIIAGMPGPTDYKKWENFDCSSDEEVPKELEFSAEEDQRLLAELPADLSPELQLILAAKENQQHLLKLLLDRGVNVNALDPRIKDFIPNSEAPQLGVHSPPAPISPL